MRCLTYENQIMKCLHNFDRQIVPNHPKMFNFVDTSSWQLRELLSLEKFPRVPVHSSRTHRVIAEQRASRDPGLSLLRV